MTLLAGSIHVTIMDGLVVATLAVHVGLSRSEKKSARALPAVVIVVVAVSALVGVCAVGVSMVWRERAGCGFRKNSICVAGTWHQLQSKGDFCSLARASRCRRFGFQSVSRRIAADPCGHRRLEMLEPPFDSLPRRTRGAFLPVHVGRLFVHPWRTLSAAHSREGSRAGSLHLSDAIRDGDFGGVRNSHSI